MYAEKHAPFFSCVRSRACVRARERASVHECMRACEFLTRHRTCQQLAHRTRRPVLGNDLHPAVHTVHAHTSHARQQAIRPAEIGETKYEGDRRRKGTEAQGMGVKRVAGRAAER